MSPTTTEQQQTPDPTPQPLPQGPLSTLAQSATSSSLIQRARSALPDSPAVTRVKSQVETALHQGDIAIAAAQSTARSARATLDTDEGQQLRKSASDLWTSLYQFLTMLFRLLLSNAESTMGVPTPDPANPQPTAQRAVRVAKTAVSNVAQRVETRERNVAGTVEADAYKYARGAANLGVSAAAYAMDNLKAYEGPGRAYVAPVLEAYQTLVVEDPDMQKADVVHSPAVVKEIPVADSAAPAAQATELAEQPTDGSE